MKRLFPSAFGVLLIFASGVFAASVDVDVKSVGNNTSIVALVTDVTAPQTLVWKFLTDYDHQAEYLPHMTKSRATAREERNLVVDQEGKFRILFWTFTLRVKQKVVEEPMTRVQFRAVEGDFDMLEGNFQLTSMKEGAQTRFASHFTVKPKKRVPDWAVRIAARRYLKAMMQTLAKKAEDASGG